jgi:hypothetical protein
MPVKFLMRVSGNARRVYCLALSLPFPLSPHSIGSHAFQSVRTALKQAASVLLLRANGQHHTLPFSYLILPRRLAARYLAGTVRR